MDVSVPCEGCGKDIRFGQTKCPNCNAPVSRDLRRALEERLEGSSKDFRSMRNRVREVGILLLVLGLLTLVLGGFIFFSAPNTNDPFAAQSERTAFALNCIVGAGMVTSFFFVEAHPQKTIVSVLAGWFLIHIVVAVLFPIDLLSGLLGKVATVLVLVRGFVSARAARAFHEDLARKALQGGG